MSRLVAVAVASLALAAASPAFAAHVDCGDVITQDTTLDSDLLDCAGDGVVIGAPGITLDLGGHTVDGTGAGAGFQGVDNAAGHDGVTVTGGTIRQFFDAVLFQTADDGEISRLRVDGVGYAARLENSSGNRIADNDFVGNVLLNQDSDDNHVVGNSLSGGDAVFVAGRSGQPPLIPDRNRIEGNEIRESVYGVVLGNAQGTAIVGNSITGSVSSAIAIRSGSLLTLIEGNRVARNGFGNENEFPASAISVFNSRATTVVENHVTRNAVDGIEIGGSTRGSNVVERNVTSRNGDDGIDVDPSGFTRSVTVAQNKAHHNVDLGIEASPDVTDGGGNKAHGNGNPLQCLNVSCR